MPLSSGFLQDLGLAWQLSPASPSSLLIAFDVDFLRMTLISNYGPKTET